MFSNTGPLQASRDFAKELCGKSRMKNHSQSKMRPPTEIERALENLPKAFTNIACIVVSRASWWAKPREIFHFLE